MNQTNTTVETFKIWRCIGCDSIYQSADVSCDCRVPSLHQWEEGVAVFASRDSRCPHEEHDHGICLECGANVFELLIEKAEYLKP